MSKLILVCTLIIIAMSCQANHNDPDLKTKDRYPVVAGQFYSGSKEDLYSELENFFIPLKDQEKDKELKALIVPHAGYVFSGEVAANGYSTIDPSVHYDNVFIIASSHRTYFKGASVYNLGNYITPLGTVNVNREIANQLISENKVFSYVHNAHNEEHSIEVQLPFLQYILMDSLRIVPIVLGSQSMDEVHAISRALEPYFKQNNLFLISSDFSHYPNYKDANFADHETLKSILSNSSKDFLHTIEENDRKNISNLSTSACGWTSILTLLNLTENNPDYSYQHIIYKNSGDYLNQNKSRVVGYHAIKIIYKNNARNNSGSENSMNKSGDFSIATEHQKKLLSIARGTIEYYLETGKILNIKEDEMPEEIKLQSGAFVTLHKAGNLRGCIGRFTTREPLYMTVQKMAISAATEDYRFNKVTPDEMTKIDIEISVLSPLKKIESIDEIEMGKHGIYIIDGYNRGTFLPQVATETGWSKEEFLGHCAQDKARIGWNGWKNAEIYIYEAFVFGEKL